MSESAQVDVTDVILHRRNSKMWFAALVVLVGAIVAGVLLLKPGRKTELLESTPTPSPAPAPAPVKKKEEGKTSEAPQGPAGKNKKSQCLTDAHCPRHTRCSRTGMCVPSVYFLQ